MLAAILSVAAVFALVSAIAVWWVPRSDDGGVGVFLVYLPMIYFGLAVLSLVGGLLTLAYDRGVGAGLLIGCPVGLLTGVAVVAALIFTA